MIATQQLARRLRGVGSGQGTTTTRRRSVVAGPGPTAGAPTTSAAARRPSGSCPVVFLWPDETLGSDHAS